MEYGKEMLRVKDLHVFIENDDILENLNFTVHEGDFVAVIGPNGAGKSVLLRTLLGFLPYKGEISYSPDVVMGYVPQRFSVERDLPLNAKEWLGLGGASPSGVKEALARVGFPEGSLRTPIGVLSQGQLQRLILAFALLRKPTLLLVDEPLASVDVAGSEAISQLLTKLSKDEKIAVLFVSHDLNLVHQAASHVICLDHRQMCFGTVQEALTEKTLKELFGEEQTVFVHKTDS